MKPVSAYTEEAEPQKHGSARLLSLFPFLSSAESARVISTIDARNSRCGSRVRRTTANRSSSDTAAAELLGRGERTRSAGARRAPGALAKEENDLRPLTTRRCQRRRLRGRFSSSVSDGSGGSTGSSVRTGAGVGTAFGEAGRESEARWPSGGRSRSLPTE